MIVTFYSFKGGVGRTLALANVGVALAQADHRVLVIDFDLEAPGLTRYLENVFGGALQHKAGLLELLERQRAEGDAVALLEEHTVEIMSTPRGGVLDLLTSGAQDQSYPARILGFNWSEFFQDADGGDFFEYCRSQWAQKYEFVLVDSRTGITDSGGICTIQLPDVIVPVFTASLQSVEGVIDVVRRAQEGRQFLAYDRAPAAVVPLPSRFDSRTEFALSQQWLDEFTDKFAEFYASWLPKETTVRQVLERTKLPYVAFFSFGERLPVFEETGSDPESLSYALRTFARLLESNLADTSRILASTATAQRNDVAEPAGRTRTMISASPEPGESSADPPEPEPRDRRVPAGIRGRYSRIMAVAAVAAVVAAIGLTALFSSRPGPSPGPPVIPTTAPSIAATTPTAVLAGHTDVVTSVAFGPNGRILASGSADNTVRLWDASDPATPVPIGKPLAAHSGAVTAVAFSPDGRSLATGSIDRTVRLWDIGDPATPRPLAPPTGGQTAAITSVDFSSDSRFLASASDDSTIAVWEVASPAYSIEQKSTTLRLVGTLRGHNGPVKAVTFSPAGDILASGGADRTALLWDLSRQLSQRSTANPKAPQPDSPTAPASNEQLNGLSKFRYTDIVDPGPTPGPVPSRAGPIALTGFTNAVVSVAFSPDGRTLVTGSGISMALWDVADADNPRRVSDTTGHTAPVTGVAFSPDGRVLASSSADNTVLLWDSTDPTRPIPLGKPLTGARASVTCVAFSPDGRAVAGGSADQTLFLWRPFS